MVSNLLDRPGWAIYYRDCRVALVSPAARAVWAVLDRNLTRASKRQLLGKPAVAPNLSRREGRTLYILIGLLILFIASLVAAYFGARTWHWAHVVLVVAVFLAATGFMVLAAETLRANAVLRAQVNKTQRELDKVTAKNTALEKGTKDPKIIAELTGDEVKIPEGAEEAPGIPGLEHQLFLVERNRGRVWREVAPAGVDQKTETVKATVNSPQPSGIAKDTILYLFETGEPALPDPTRGPQYLGEFRVTDVADKQVTMIAVQQLDDFELKRLAASHGPWSLHETMPVDSYKLFDGLTEEQLRKWLPEKSVQEYLRHGTAAGPDDDQWHRMGVDEDGKPVGPDNMDKAAKILYQRRLRDYSVEFDELARDRVVLLANIAGVTKDNERLKAALVSAKQLQSFREIEQQKLGVDLAGITKERAAIEQHLARVQQELAEKRDKLAENLDENARLAEQLARLQAQWKGSNEKKSTSAAPVVPLALSNGK
jgi:uncharacterized membrane-anchored protein YhcB (DUF1043 family)